MTFPILSFRNLVWYSTFQFNLATVLLLNGHMWQMAIYWAMWPYKEISEVSLEESQYLEAEYKKKLESKRTTKKENITEVREAWRSECGS